MEVIKKKFREQGTVGRVGGRMVEGHVNLLIIQSWTSQCQDYWACLLFVVQRSSVGGEWGVVVLDELLEEVLDEV